VINDDKTDTVETEEKRNLLEKTTQVHT